MELKIDVNSTTLSIEAKRKVIPKNNLNFISDKSEVLYKLAYIQSYDASSLFITNWEILPNVERNFQKTYQMEGNERIVD